MLLNQVSGKSGQPQEPSPLGRGRTGGAVRALKARIIMRAITPPERPYGGRTGMQISTKCFALASSHPSTS